MSFVSAKEEQVKKLRGKLRESKDTIQSLEASVTCKYPWPLSLVSPSNQTSYRCTWPGKMNGTLCFTNYVYMRTYILPVVVEIKPCEIYFQALDLSQTDIAPFVNAFRCSEKCISYLCFCRFIRASLSCIFFVFTMGNQVRQSVIHPREVNYTVRSLLPTANFNYQLSTSTS